MIDVYYSNQHLLRRRLPRNPLQCQFRRSLRTYGLSNVWISYRRIHIRFESRLVNKYIYIAYPFSVILFELFLLRSSCFRKFKEICNQLARFMSSRKLSLTTQKRIIMLYRYSFNDKFYNKSLIYSYLPGKIFLLPNLYTGKHSFSYLIFDVIYSFQLELPLICTNNNNKIIKKLKNTPTKSNINNIR